MDIRSDHFALILWGGSTPGQRPRTHLARIEGLRSLPDRPAHEIHSVNVTLCNATGAPEVKHSRWVNADFVVESWPSLPTPGEVKCAKQSLAKVGGGAL